MTRQLSHIARDLRARLERVFDAPLGPDATPLEIATAVVDDVERKVQPLGRGRKTFPYARVVVRVRQTNGDRAPLDAALAGLGDKLRERFGELGCDAPRGLDVKVHLLKKAPSTWTPGQLFAVEYDAPPAAESAGHAPSSCGLIVTIVKGSASKKSYSFTEQVISIGRTAAPTDGDGRVRRNHVAFLDTVDGITETVGRAHAYLRFDSGSREYRLFDNGSSNGTSIVRDGVAIVVPPRDPRGVRLCSGDEVQVGRALLRVTIPSEPARWR